MNLMYNQTIDYAPLPISDMIRLLRFSNFFQSDVLKKFAFDYLYEIGYKHTSQNLLQLCLVQMEHPFDELKQLCEWLLSINPTFREDLLKDK